MASFTDLSQLLHSEATNFSAYHRKESEQSLRKVDIDLKTAVDCVNNLQSLMKSCRDVSNNDPYDEIYQKMADMVSPEEISVPRIVKHPTMRSNVATESSKNYYLRNLYYHFWTV